MNITEQPIFKRKLFWAAIFILAVACIFIVYLCSRPVVWEPEGLQDASSIRASITGNINGRDYLFAAVAYYPPDDSDVFLRYIARDLLILDIENPQKPKRVAVLSGDDYTDINGLYLKDNCIFATDSNGLRIIDVADPSNPREIKKYEDIHAYDIAIYEQTAYINQWNHQLIIADITNPEDLKIISEYPLGFRSPDNLMLSGSKLLCMGDDGIHIIDISNPALIKELSVIQDSAYQDYLPQLEQGPYVRTLSPEEAELTMHQFRYYTVDGNTVYVTAGLGGIKIFDISDPAHPLQIAACKIDNNIICNHLLAAGELVYVQGNIQNTSGNKLFVIDVNDPQNPKMLKHISLPAYHSPFLMHTAHSSYNHLTQVGDYIYTWSDKSFKYSDNVIRARPILVIFGT
jgi:hypothetical protein